MLPYKNDIPVVYVIHVLEILQYIYMYVVLHTFTQHSKTDNHTIGKKIFIDLRANKESRYNRETVWIRNFDVRHFFLKKKELSQK